MKNYISILLLILFFTFNCKLFPQDSLWTKYTSNNQYLFEIAEEGDYLWLVKNTDIIKINKTTRDSERFYSLGSVNARTISSFSVDKNNIKWFRVLLNRSLYIPFPSGAYSYASFDGAHTTIYNSSNSPLPDSIFWPSNICVDAVNNKWFGTEQGLFKYDGANWTLYDSTSSSLLNKGVLIVKTDRQNKIWAYTGNGAFIKFDGTEWELINEISPGAYGNITDFSFDLENNLYFSSNNKVYKYDGAQLTSLPDPVTFPEGFPGIVYFNKIVFDSDNNLWIGEFGGVHKFNGTEWAEYRVKNKISGITDIIRTIYADGRGDIWAGTGAIRQDGSLAKFNGTDWDLTNIHSPYLPSNNITGIAVDKNNDKWIATNNGLAKTDGTNWVVYDSTNSGLPSNLITTVAIDKNGVKWIGDSLGILVKYDNKDWTTFATENTGFPKSGLSCIAFDSKGTNWMGTFSYTGGGGVVKFDGFNTTIFNSSNSDLPQNNVFTIAVDKNDNIWVGTANGIAKFDGSNWLVYFKADSNSARNEFYSIVFDDSGNTWCGANLGLFKFDGTNWILYDYTNTGLNNFFQAKGVVIDGNGVIWFTIPVFGLGKYDGVNWSVAPDRLPESLLFEKIVLDNEQKKWLTNEEGIYVYSGESVVTDIKEKNINENPDGYYLSYNYPNPFNPTTTISYRVPSSGLVTIKVYDILGKEITTLVNEEKQPGKYEVKFDGSNLSSGVYFYRIQAGSFIQTRKLLLLK